MFYIHDGDDDTKQCACKCVCVTINKLIFSFSLTMMIRWWCTGGKKSENEDKIKLKKINCLKNKNWYWYISRLWMNERIFFCFQTHTHSDYQLSDEFFW